MDVALRKASTKLQILEEAGYKYNLDRRLYVNKKQKTAFSLAFLDDHSEAEIARRIREDSTKGTEWHFFFNEAPTEAVRQQLADLLD